jgi:cell division protein FtsB
LANLDGQCFADWLHLKVRALLQEEMQPKLTRIFTRTPSDPRLVLSVEILVVRILVFEVAFPYCVAPRRLKLKTLKSVIRTLRKQKRIAAQTIEKLTREVERIDAGIAALNTGSPSAGKTRKRRKLSKAARQRISAAQKKRWAAERKAAS